MMKIITKRQKALYEIDRNETLRLAHDNPVVKHLYDDFLIKPLGRKIPRITAYALYCEGKILMRFDVVRTIEKKCRRLLQLRKVLPRQGYPGGKRAGHRSA
jgi:hypothetical protein